MTSEMSKDGRSPIAPLAIVAMFILGMTCLAPISGQVAVDAHRAIVRVETRSHSASNPSKVGSGFLISRDGRATYLLTAQHVVNGAADIWVHFAAALDGPPVKAQIVVSNQNLDVAVLRTETAPNGVEILGLHEQPPVSNERVSFWGYSFERRRPTLRQAAVFLQDGTDLLVEAAVDEMDSGSPVLHQGGVACSIKAKDGRFTRCTSSAILSNALQGWRIPFTKVSWRAEGKLEFHPRPGNECTARIISSTGGGKSTYIGATRQAPAAGFLSEGTVVTIVDRRFSDGEPWYRIATSERSPHRYIPEIDLQVGPNCQ